MRFVIDMIQLPQFLSSRRFIHYALIQIGLILAAALGVGISRFGSAVFGLLVAPAAGLLLYAFSHLGLYLLTLTLSIEELLPGIGGATGTRLLGMIVFAVWLVRKFLRRESWRPVLTVPLLQISGLFLLWILASMFWAEFTDLTLVGLFSMVQLALFGVIVIDQVDAWERLERLAIILVLAGLVAAVATLEQYFIQGVKRAGDGVSGGVNYTASILVSTMPFAFYLLRTPRPRKGWRLLGLLFTGLGSVAIAVTFSRSSYIYFLLVIVLTCLQGLGSGSGRGWIFAFVALAFAAVLMAPREAVASRLQTITPGLENWFATLNGDSLLADVRGYHWRVGLAMFRDSPLVGVGYNNFGTLFLAYQMDVPGAPEIFSTPRSPHSSYVGILSELGLVGISLWLVILFLSVRGIVQAWTLVRKEGDTNKLLLVQAVGMILMLQLLYGWVLNAHMNKIYWFILGLCVVVQRIAASQEAHIDAQS